MNRIIFFLILIFILNPIQCLLAQNNKLFWSQKRALSVTDFKALIKNDNSYENALASVGISYSVTFDNSKADIVIKTFFRTDLSWFDKSIQSDWLLQHEQGHFDIAEIFARKLKKEMSNILFPKNNDCNKVVTDMYDKYFNEMKKMQELYDKETDHSRNRNEQLRWLKKIDRLLQQYSYYSTENLDKHKLHTSSNRKQIIQ